MSVPPPLRGSLIKASPPVPATIEYDHPAAPQIGKWMRDNVLTVDRNEYGNCYKLKVVHFSVNKKPQGDVTQLAVSSSLETDPGGIDALINEVIQAAQEDANTLHQGIQLYAVFAYYSKNQYYTPRRYFRVAAEEEYDPETSGADPSETPDARGLTAQLMRHNESLMKTSVMNTSYLIQTLMEENKSQRLLIHQQAAQSVEMGALIQETLDNSTARRIAEREAETRQGMISSAFEHLKLLLPVLLNKIAGQKIAPETDPSFNLLAALFEGMPQEQQQDLVTKFLTPTQAAVFAEFLETYEKRKRTLTSANSPGPQLNLRSLFDSLPEQKASETGPRDPKLTAMEAHAKSFRETFSLPTFTGPIKPITK